MSDYSDIFGREPEPWREPLGALRLTLADESATPWQIERARAECEALVKVLNEHPPADQGKPQVTARPSDAALVDLYWKASGDDWAIPDWLMVKYGRAVLEAALGGEA